MTLRIEAIPADALAARAAIFIADRVWSATAERGEAHLALSGGRTPAAMIAALAGQRLPWDVIHVWQVDERVAPDGDTARNAVQLDPLVDAGARVHLMDVTAADLHDAAQAYGEALDARLDVVHLGLGDDGHTASWPPGDPVVDTMVDTVERCAVVGPFNGHVRMTLTPPVVNGARCRFFLVSGDAKRPMLERLVAADPDYPAARVRHEATVVLTDVPGNW